MSNAIELKNICKAYNGFSLENISFNLPTGCILGLVGENGAGKSTTVNIIMNALKADSGEVRVLGINNSDREFCVLKNDIGVVLDEGNFPEMLNIKQINKILKLTYKNWNQQRFDNLIDIFSLPYDKEFKNFSRGMKMKLSIAAALSHNPKLLVLDEPTSGLDPIVRDEIIDVFNDFTRDEGHSILISSHIISDLEKICDYLAFIHKGKLKLFEEKDRLLNEYGLIYCSKDEIELLPEDAVIGVRNNNYNISALVKKSKTPNGFSVGRASIEEIILYMVKGEKNESLNA